MRTVKEITRERRDAVLDDFLASGLARVQVNVTPDFELEPVNAWLPGIESYITRYASPPANRASR
jgi:hypothetical protein